MIKKIIYISLIWMVFHGASLHAASLLVEAESFTEKGGWVVDQQFMDLMGSPYLLAHGLGSPVENASTNVQLPENGTYYIFVRTYNWTSPWQEGEGPGLFGLSVNGKKISYRLGIIGNQWIWQYAGQYQATEKNIHIVLHDLKGFDGRCDAIYFTTRKDDIPPSDMAALNNFRRAKLGLLAPPKTESYDLVVIGAGIAGMSTAVSAARLGCKVALINDRPVVGGNNSSEIRVHLGGAIEIGKYPELGGLQKEFGPVKEGNAQPAGNYEDHKKMEWLQAETNVSLFLNYRAFSVKKEEDRIISITACHIESGEEIEFYGRLFADCTGDVTSVKPGDRVTVNVETFCGECFFCRRGYVNNCTDPNGGWALGCRIDGGQAEYVRVPYADQGLNRIPDTVSDEQALFVGDVLATGFWATRISEISEDDTVLIIGAGPTGICTLLCVMLKKPRRIIVCEKSPERIRFVREHYPDVLVVEPENCKEFVIQNSEHGGADVVLEVAGSKDTFRLAWECARPNAVVTIVALYDEPQILPLPDMYGKNLIFKTGGVDGCDCAEILNLIEEGKIDTTPLITHRFPLNEIEEAYRIFENKLDGVIKVAIYQ